MALHSIQTDALKSFCDLILCGHEEKVFCRCKECLEHADDDYGGIPRVLYILSGNDTEPDDPSGDIADEDKPLVKQQFYLISSDAGAPDLEDFFWFVENLKTARGLNFAVDKEKFSNDDCIVEWLAELSVQLEDLYIVNFDGASEDYHFTIMSRDDCEKAMDLFKKMTAHVSGYSYTSYLITGSFEG